MPPPMTLQQMVAQATQAAAQANQAADQALAALDAMRGAQGAQGGGAGDTSSFIASSLCLPYYFSVAVVMAANASGVQGIIQMAADSTFELLRIVGISSADNPTDYAPNYFSFQLQDGATSRFMSTQPIPQAAALTRSYQYGNDEKYPIRFPANSVLNVICNNLTGFQLTATIVLKGYKFFQIAPNNPPASG